ncbi:MAG: glycerophosphodiester phosphodiesterase family protein [Eubacteriales bacterium]|nr:glycerophosphodiester phosphodiesterase family protein [Eubacteriales bacterium]
MENQKVLIASHRGCFGGNIVENTLEAFEAAICCGADIVETDIHKTKDGVMILFHDPSPMRLLELPGLVEDYTLAELRSAPLKNVIGNRSDSYVTTLDELLTALKGRCLINLDQCWHFIDEVYDAVAAKGMEDQALIKGRVPYDEVVAWIRSRGFVPQFIPIITCDEELAQFDTLPKELRIPQVEVFVQNDEDHLISPAFIARLQQRGIRLWINALSLGGGIDMSAHHDDDRSLTVSPDEGWGWLIRRGVGVIQTDWTAQLRRYLDAQGL